MLEFIRMLQGFSTYRLRTTVLEGGSREQTSTKASFPLFLPVRSQGVAVANFYFILVQPDSLVPRLCSLPWRR